MGGNMGQVKPQLDYRPPYNKGIATMAPKKPNKEPDIYNSGCMKWFAIFVFITLAAFVYFWMK